MSISAQIETVKGVIKISFFPTEAPVTVTNFVNLALKNFYDGLTFHRVIGDFMIQGGNSDSKLVANKRNELGKYLLPNDFDRGYKHVRGMVSMPSSLINNPHKMASPFEFFIVQSKKGAFHLHQDNTNYGKVIKSKNDVDKISNARYRRTFALT